MSGMNTKRKRRTWLDRLPRGLLERLHAEIDCRAESLAAIYRRWNLIRFCAPRTWRLYAGRRRQKIREYEPRTGRAASRAAWERHRSTSGAMQEAKAWADAGGQAGLCV